jgi:hypothetical protein
MNLSPLLTITTSVWLSGAELVSFTPGGALPSIPLSFSLATILPPDIASMDAYVYIYTLQHSKSSFSDETDYILSLPKPGKPVTI